MLTLKTEDKPEKYKLIKKGEQYPDNINNFCSYYYSIVKSKNINASKRYVEKFLFYYIGEHIDNNNLIMPTLWNS